MTANPSTVRPDTLLTEAAEEIIEERYSGMPVVDEEGHLVGLLEVADLLPFPSQVPFSQVPVLEFQGEWLDEDDLDAFSEGLRTMTVKEVMRTEPPTVPPNTPLAKVLRKLIEEGDRRLLVVDEEDKLVGVVTRTDLLRAFYGWD